MPALERFREDCVVLRSDRSRGPLAVRFVVAAALPLVLAVLLLVLASAVSWTHWWQTLHALLITAAVALILVTGALLVLAGRAGRRQVELRSDTVTVVSLAGRRQVPWTQVAGVVLVPRPYLGRLPTVPVLQLTDSTLLTADCLDATDAGMLREYATRIRGPVLQRFTPPTAAPPTPLGPAATGSLVIAPPGPGSIPNVWRVARSILATRLLLVTVTLVAAYWWVGVLGVLVVRHDPSGAVVPGVVGVGLLALRQAVRWAYWRPARLTKRPWSPSRQMAGAARPGRYRVAFDPPAGGPPAFEVALLPNAWGTRLLGVAQLDPALVGASRPRPIWDSCRFAPVAVALTELMNSY